MTERSSENPHVDPSENRELIRTKKGCLRDPVSGKFLPKEKPTEDIGKLIKQGSQRSVNVLIKALGSHDRALRVRAATALLSLAEKPRYQTAERALSPIMAKLIDAYGLRLQAEVDALNEENNGFDDDESGE